MRGKAASLVPLFLQSGVGNTIARGKGMSDQEYQSGADHLESDGAEKGERPLTYTSHELLQGRNEIWIEHGDDMYRLRLTSAGKLYLTK